MGQDGGKGGDFIGGRPLRCELPHQASCRAVGAGWDANPLSAPPAHDAITVLSLNDRIAVTVLSRCGHGVVTVWLRCGHGMVTVWSRCGHRDGGSGRGRRIADRGGGGCARQST
jgi:hypothetical protein